MNGFLFLAGHLLALLGVGLQRGVSGFDALGMARIAVRRALILVGRRAKTLVLEKHFSEQEIHQRRLRIARE